ncbi:MAG: ABC transporter ATP-binding protein [Clostridiales bacterium]|jgi:putative ABC transport system ATP-binding protein|nr:ABC transporter ATP-binding protein [Clostridiales bacterium]
MSDKFIYTARGIKKAYPLPGGELFWALKGVDVDIPQGGLTILKGRSGSGKTTLMNILGALDDATEGQVIFDGVNISQMPEKERNLLRRRSIGFVFQSVALIPIMTAQENVEYALRLSGYSGNLKDRALRCLDMVGLKKRAGHMPQELSGGEQQRVAIARAIAHRPKIILADEPTGELDTSTALKVVRIFRELNEKENVTILMTTHDRGFMDIGDRAYELEDGEIKNEY